MHGDSGNEETIESRVRGAYEYAAEASGMRPLTIRTPWLTCDGSRASFGVAHRDGIGFWVTPPVTEKTIPRADEVVDGR